MSSLLSIKPDTLKQKLSPENDYDSDKEQVRKGRDKMRRDLRATILGKVERQERGAATSEGDNSESENELSAWPPLQGVNVATRTVQSV